MYSLKFFELTKRNDATAFGGRRALIILNAAIFFFEMKNVKKSYLSFKIGS